MGRGGRGLGERACAVPCALFGFGDASGEGGAVGEAALLLALHLEAVAAGAVGEVGERGLVFPKCDGHGIVFEDAGEEEGLLGMEAWHGGHGGADGEDSRGEFADARHVEFGAGAPTRRGDGNEWSVRRWGGRKHAGIEEGARVQSVQIIHFAFVAEGAQDGAPGFASVRCPRRDGLIIFQ